MARKVADLLPERDTYEVVEGQIAPVEDADTEAAWDAWTDDLKTAGTGGKVRVYKVPSDDDGNPKTNAKGAQLTYLGAWEHQQYGFDEMCQMLTQKFLTPGENCYVRMIGLRAGARGIQFNRFVKLQRDATDVSPNSPQGALDSVIRAMQDTQRQTSEMVQRLAGPRELIPSNESRSVISPELKEVLIACIPVMGTIVGALIQRPKPQSDMATLIEAMGKMKEFISGESPSGNDDSTLSIVKAVAPGAMQLLTTLAQRQPAPMPRRVQVQPTPGTVPTRITGPVTQPTPAPVPQTNSAQLLESDPMLAQLAPQLETLAQIAETNADPNEVAKLVLDSVPESFDEKLWELVSEPARFNRLFLLAPKLNTHKEWMEKLRVALVAEYTDDVPVATPEPLNESSAS